MQINASHVSQPNIYEAVRGLTSASCPRPERLPSPSSDGAHVDDGWWPLSRSGRWCYIVVTHPWHDSYLGPGASLLGWGLPVHHRVLSRPPTPCPPHAGSPLANTTSSKCLQTWPDVPWAAILFPFENYCFTPVENSKVLETPKLLLLGCFTKY